nr:ATP-dependent dethiobiotin synthetase BioD-like [Nerophis lumbriciformis]
MISSPSPKRAATPLRQTKLTPAATKAPSPPLAAGRIEGHFPDIPTLTAHTNQLQNQCDLLLVEGAGGWHVPLTKTENLADLAKAIDLPILLVVNNRLGALNHTLLTLEAIQNSGQICLGIILNHLEEERDLATVTNPTLLRELTDVPILAEVLTTGEFIDWLDPTYAP